MARLSNRDYLLNELRSRCAGADRKILNSDVFNALGWTREKFLKVRNQLYDQDILTYEGHYTRFVNFKRDGCVRASCRIFLSYSHADEEMKIKLLKHLTPLVHLNLIETWHDRDMKPGDNIDNEITKNLVSANLILLLVSADFLNSKYCYDIEMQQAVDRHRHGLARVIPVVLRHCYWHEAPFGKLLAATKDGKPVSDYTTPDAAFLEIVTAIRKQIET